MWLFFVLCRVFNTSKRNCEKKCMLVFVCFMDTLIGFHVASSPRPSPSASRIYAGFCMRSMWFMWYVQ